MYGDFLVEAWPWILGGSAFFVLPAILLVRSVWLRSFKKNGRRGQAKIFSLPYSDSASFVQGSVTLVIELPGEDPYRLTKTMMVPMNRRASALKAGEVPVWVDRHDKERVLVDWDALPTDREAAATEAESYVQRALGKR